MKNLHIREKKLYISQMVFHLYIWNIFSEIRSINRFFKLKVKMTTLISAKCLNSKRTIQKQTKGERTSAVLLPLFFAYKKEICSFRRVIRYYKI